MKKLEGAGLILFAMFSHYEHLGCILAQSKEVLAVV